MLNYNNSSNKIFLNIFNKYPHNKPNNQYNSNNTCLISNLNQFVKKSHLPKYMIQTIFIIKKGPLRILNVLYQKNAPIVEKENINTKTGILNQIKIKKNIAKKAKKDQREALITER